MPKLRFKVLIRKKVMTGELKKSDIEIDTDALDNTRTVRWSCLIDRTGRPFQLIYNKGLFYVRYTKGKVQIKEGEEIRYLSEPGLKDDVWKLDIPIRAADVTLEYSVSDLSPSKLSGDQIPELPWNERVGKGYTGKFLAPDTYMEKKIQELEKAEGTIVPSELEVARRLMRKLEKALKGIERAVRTETGVIEGIFLKQELRQLLEERRTTYQQFLSRLKNIIAPEEVPLTIISSEIPAKWKWTWLSKIPKWEDLRTISVGKSEPIKPGETVNIPAPFKGVGGKLVFRKGNPNASQSDEKSDDMLIQEMEYESPKRQREIAVLAVMNWIRLKYQPPIDEETWKKPYISGPGSVLIGRVFRLIGMPLTDPRFKVDRDIVQALQHDIAHLEEGPKALLGLKKSLDFFVRDPGREETIALAKLIFETLKGQRQLVTTISRGELSKAAEVTLEEPGKVAEVKLEGETAEIVEEGGIASAIAQSSSQEARKPDADTATLRKGQQKEKEEREKEEETPAALQKIGRTSSVSDLRVDKPTKPTTRPRAGSV